MDMEKKDLEKDRKLFMFFKRAVEAEREAQKMYKDAIRFCRDPELADVLQAFYEDEVRHEKEVVTRYNALKRRLPKEETE